MESVGGEVSSQCVIIFAIQFTAALQHTLHNSAKRSIHGISQKQHAYNNTLKPWNTYTTPPLIHTQEKKRTWRGAATLASGLEAFSQSSVLAFSISPFAFSRAADIYLQCKHTDISIYIFSRTSTYDEWCIWQARWSFCDVSINYIFYMCQRL